MKKISLLSLIFLVFISYLYTESVRVAGDSDQWIPLFFKDENNLFRGALYEILDKVLEGADYEYEIELFPWKRALIEVEIGRSEILVASFYSDERAKKYWFTPALFNLRRGFFYSTRFFPNSPYIEGWEDLKRFKIIGLKGYTYGGDYEEEGLISFRADNSDQALSMVLNGRGDLFLDSLDQIYGHPYFQELIKGGKIDYLLLPFEPGRSFHLLVSRNSYRSIELFRNISSSIDNLHQRGIISDILRENLPELYR